MTEDKKEKIEKTENKKEEKSTSKSTPVKPAQRQFKPMMQGKNKPKNRRFNKNRRGREPEEFEQRIVDIARVTRVMAGGKRMRF